MRKNRFNMFKGAITTLAVGAFVVGCGSSNNSSSGGGGNNSSTSGVVTIDAMTSVPVINGASTRGALYIHNDSNKTVTDFKFSVDKQVSSSKITQLLASVGFKTASSIQSEDGFILDNLDKCTQIPAGGYCVINFNTPALSVGNRGNSLVTLNYELNGVKLTTNQVVSYSYVDPSVQSGVNFTGGLNVTGKQGETRHVVGYLYGGGVPGTKYQNVRLDSSSSNTVISGGFIDSQEVVAGQVIAVDYAVVLQNNGSSFANITPTWGETVASSSKQFSIASGEVNVGTPLALSLNAVASTSNVIFGNIPILAVPGVLSATIYATNNGNAATVGGLTVASDNPDLEVQNNCTNPLLANAANSCTFTFNVRSEVYTSGTATVTFKNNNNVTIGVQTVVWINSLPVPMIYIERNPESASFGKGASLSNVTFTVTNIGKAPLNSAVFTSRNTGSATWTPSNNNECRLSGAAVTSILPGTSCVITGTLNGTDDGVGALYYTASGNFNSTDYSFRSLPLNYIVSAAPALTITPNTGVSMTLLANNESTITQVFTVQNMGNDPALFTSLGLTTQNDTALKPIIITDGSAVTPICTSSTELDAAESCAVTVKYGPAATSLTANESSIADLSIDYHGGTPDTNHNLATAFNYNLVGNDATVILSSIDANGVSGLGTEASPYSGYASSSDMSITLTYQNPSINYDLTNFNLNTSNLPFGVTVDPTSTCKTGAETSSLAMGGTCLLVLDIDRELLVNNAPQGGSNVLNITSPVATWSTPMGFYKTNGVGLIYLTYLQPTIAFVLSHNNAYFESTVLTMTASNESYATTLNARVSGVSKWLVNSPTNLSPNCSIISESYAVSCNLKTNSIGSVTYLMPNDLAESEIINIPLKFSIASGEYAYLNPSYTFITLTSQFIKKIFVTASRVAGDFGGAAGADGICAGDAKKPNDGNTYKALIGDSTRIACTTANCSGGSSEHTDWILEPNTVYTQVNGSNIIFTTNANGIFVSWPANNPISATLAPNYWSGLTVTWMNNANNCTNWTNNTVGISGGSGYPVEATDEMMIYYTTNPCNVTRPLVCVQQ